MITRRDTLTLMRSGLALGAIGAAGVVSQCHPTEAPAAVHDPMLDLIERYRTQMAVWNASPLEGDAFDALGDEIANPLWYELRDNPPEITTEAGAIAAVRLVVDELSHSVGGFERSLTRAVLAYFDGKRGDGSNL